MNYEIGDSLFSERSYDCWTLHLGARLHMLCKEEREECHTQRISASKLLQSLVKSVIKANGLRWGCRSTSKPTTAGELRPVSSWCISLQEEFFENGMQAFMQNYQCTCAVMPTCEQMPVFSPPTLLVGFMLTLKAAICFAHF